MRNSSRASGLANSMPISVTIRRQPLVEDAIGVRGEDLVAGHAIAEHGYLGVCRALTARVGGLRFGLLRAGRYEINETSALAAVRGPKWTCLDAGR